MDMFRLNPRRDITTWEVALLMAYMGLHVDREWLDLRPDLARHFEDTPAKHSEGLLGDLQPFEALTPSDIRRE